MSKYLCSCYSFTDNLARIYSVLAAVGDRKTLSLTIEDLSCKPWKTQTKGTFLALASFLLKNTVLKECL